MREDPDSHEGRLVCAQATPPQQEGQKKPKIVKVGGLSVIDRSVIPRKEANQRPGHFFSVSMALQRDSSLTPSQKTVLNVLHDRRGKKDRAWPSLATLATDTALAESTVSNAIEKLAEAGLLIVDRGGGRRRSNRYYLTQRAFPCKQNPKVLCDRTSCPGDCDWSVSSISAVMSQMDQQKPPDSRGECPDENTPATGEFKEETHRPSVSFAPETPRGSDTNQGRTATTPRKKAGKEPSAACGGGGDAPPPSSKVEVQTPGHDPGDHHEFKFQFCQRYETAFGKPYVWQGQDTGILKNLLQSCTLDQLKAAVEVMFRDPWAMKDCKASLKVLSSKINQYLPPANGPRGLPAPPPDAGSQWDQMAVEVHTLPQEGEEPATWLFPRKHTVRSDDDIPAGIKDRQMSKFSAEIIRQAMRWLHADGSWALTMGGPCGNGKSSVAATILQCYRDQKYPNDDQRSYTAFVSHEEFNRTVIVDGVNPTTGWIGDSTLNEETISWLITKHILVLDDVCNGSMSGLQIEALRDVLRSRHVNGLGTIITTNRTMQELGQILGASVADRLAGGMVLRFVDESLRGQINASGPSIPAPEGEELVAVATDSLEAMGAYIQYGAGAFQRPLSREKVPTAYDQSGGTNCTVESVAGHYWYWVCAFRENLNAQLRMPRWEALFENVRRLADHVGGLENASRYLAILMTAQRWEAIEAARAHVQQGGKKFNLDESFFLQEPIWNLMASVLPEIIQPA